MTTINRSARVGVITDQADALSFTGIANVNVAKMVIDDLNDRGGLLGRPVELFVEDSAADDSVAEVAAARLVERAAGVVVGGIYSSTRQAIRRPMVGQAETLYIYPEQYEGQACHPLIFCTGPVPGAAGRALLSVADAADRGEALLHALGRRHLAADNEPLTGRVRSSIAGSPS
jgi:ABC-type branched-subunit amino acid transport system substrate-binding protein